jgi:hypothetical protein
MVAGFTTIPLVTFNSSKAETFSPGDFLTRLEGLALVQTLNGEILASRSATLSLEKWCRDHGLAGAGDAKVIARLSGNEPKQSTAEQRHRLGISPEAAVKHRHVQLFCGEQSLSEADNWYVPNRMTAEMNRVLETTASTALGQPDDVGDPRRHLRASSSPVYKRTAVFRGSRAVSASAFVLSLATSIAIEDVPPWVDCTGPDVKPDQLLRSQARLGLLSLSAEVMAVAEGRVPRSVDQANVGAPGVLK